MSKPEMERKGNAVKKRGARAYFAVEKIPPHKYYSLRGCVIVKQNFRTYLKSRKGVVGETGNHEKRGAVRMGSRGGDLREIEWRKNPGACGESRGGDLSVDVDRRRAD